MNEEEKTNPTDTPELDDFDPSEIDDNPIFNPSSNAAWVLADALVSYCLAMEPVLSSPRCLG
jgi:hypothetical protein